MPVRYAISPSIGVARLGNSHEFYISPDRIAALPIQCDPKGNVLEEGGKPSRVTEFKDRAGRIKRQAALFTIFRLEEGKPAVEITLKDSDVKTITWSAHLANKKACWYNFAELEGNLLYGESNSYANRHVPFRNADVTSVDERRKLIIDPGPRTLSGASKTAEFSKTTVPANYKYGSFPDKVKYGEQIDTLGGMLTDKEGRLLVLGGFGKSGGDTSISSFAGADTWHDDISDGPVNCVLELKSGEKIELKAWCLVGSPKFVPEIANIVTLADTMYDVAVRHLNVAPKMFAGGKFNADYVANFDQEIKPILDRPAAYRWVANVPSMNSVSPPPFDARDNSAKTAGQREAYIKLFRRPDPEHAIGPDSQTLFTQSGFPLMPLNSGSNSVSNELIDKFLALTETQYFLLQQWVKGKFSNDPGLPQNIVAEMTQGSVGNCVGGPFCPGIEVTWSVRNQNIYSGPFEIKQRHDEAWYFEKGLNPNEDETESNLGCEPGDMTKRMAIPWQADFFQCSIQFINFTNPKVNKADGIPLPPTYYSYWWPPQSPWQVMTGDLTPEEQALAGTPSGFQVLFSRGINTFSEMISYWYYMGFVVNQMRGPDGQWFPYFTEQERNHAAFVAAAVAVGDSSNVVSGEDTNFSNAWYLARKPQPPTAPVTLAAAEKPHKPAAQAVSFGSSRQRGRRPLRED
jgi:L-lysine 6-oxidase